MRGGAVSRGAHAQKNTERGRRSQCRPPAWGRPTLRASGRPLTSASALAVEIDPQGQCGSKVIGNFPFHLRDVKAEAPVGAGSEREDSRRATPDVEGVRVRELTFLTIGRRIEEQDGLALAHLLPMDHAVLDSELELGIDVVAPTGPLPSTTVAMRFPSTMTVVLARGGRSPSTRFAPLRTSRFMTKVSV